MWSRGVPDGAARPRDPPMVGECEETGGRLRRPQVGDLHGPSGRRLETAPVPLAGPHLGTTFASRKAKKRAKDRQRQQRRRQRDRDGRKVFQIEIDHFAIVEVLVLLQLIPDNLSAARNDLLVGEILGRELDKWARCVTRDSAAPRGVLLQIRGMEAQHDLRQVTKRDSRRSEHG